MAILFGQTVYRKTEQKPIINNVGKQFFSCRFSFTSLKNSGIHHCTKFKNNADEAWKILSIFSISVEINNNFCRMLYNIYYICSSARHH